MAVQSTMLPLGTKAPEFELKDITSGASISLQNFVHPAFGGVNKKALLIIFICRHCPYVKHVQREIAKIGEDYKDSNLAIVAISSNDPAAYPEDAPESLAQQAKELRFEFPYCFDETQSIARAYHAACTPDFFLFDQNRKLAYQAPSSGLGQEPKASGLSSWCLAYRGQLDDSRPGNNEPTDGHSLRAAIEAVLSGSKVSEDQKPSMGCSIKWKS